jgi:4'-phosphopantetheinyl transferase
MRSVVDVHVLDLDCVDPELYRLFSLLDAEEVRRAKQFRFQRDRDRYIVRHGRIRELLARYLGAAPERITFSTNAYGKPAADGTDLRFNLSHSHNLALLAVTRGRELGCDLEFRDPAFASNGVAEAFFSCAEIAALLQIGPPGRAEAFFNCWTRKEAYIKARGHGVSLPLDSFDVALAPGERAALLKGCDGWSVQSFEPAPCFHAAVVAEGADWQLRLGSTA